MDGVVHHQAKLSGGSPFRDGSMAGSSSDDVEHPPSSIVSITVLSIKPVKFGKIFALASVEIDIDGVPLVIHGVRAIRVHPMGPGSTYPCSAMRAGSGVMRSHCPKRFVNQSAERCSTSLSSVVWRLEVRHHGGPPPAPMSRNCGNSWPYNRERDRLSGLWREPFNHLTRHAIHDFRSFSCLCRGPCSPSRFTKLVRPYQASVLYANLKHAIWRQCGSPTPRGSLSWLTLAWIELFRDFADLLASPGASANRMSNRERIVAVRVVRLSARSRHASASAAHHVSRSAMTAARMPCARTNRNNTKPER